LEQELILTAVIFSFKERACYFRIDFCDLDTSLCESEITIHAFIQLCKWDYCIRDGNRCRPKILIA